MTTSPATNVTVNSTSALLYGDSTFALTNVSLTSGDNTFTAIAQDSYGRTDTNTITASLPATNTFYYDSRGNLTNDGKRVFVYDDENQLTSVLVSNAWLSQFSYDGLLRRRVRKEYRWAGSAWSLTNEVRYVYDGRLVVQERDANNLALVSYTRGNDLSGTMHGAGGIGGLLARTDHSTLNSQLSTSPHAYYHADGNGNVTALLGTNGIVVARYHYDPYGNTLAAVGPLAEANLYRFSSKEWHPNSGTIYYLYRFYDPNLQRWLNHDPVGEYGGLNLYAYVSNDPVDFIDAFGLKWKVCVRSSDGHSWIYATNLDTGEEHTYGRWRRGFGGRKESGVAVDTEKGKNKYKDYSERCMEVDAFTPTINKGFGTEKPGEKWNPPWSDLHNNCATYACDEWARVSGENLYRGPFGLYDHPSNVRSSIDQWNQSGGNPHRRPPGWRRDYQ